MMAVGAVLILAFFIAEIKPSIEVVGCGKDLTAEDTPKYFYAPSASSLRYKDLKCTLRFRSKNQDKKVVLELKHLSYLRYGCSRINVTIYSGIGLTRDLLKSWCGSQRENRIVSDESSATIVFYRRPYVSARIRIKYYQAYRHNCGRLYASTYKKDLVGSVLHPSRGRYECSWTIEASGMKRIGIHVLRSQLKNSGNCQNESVTIYDGNDMSSSVLGKWCGNQRPAYVSTGQSILVYLASDRPIRDGFKIRYWTNSDPPMTTTTQSPNCGGHLRALASFIYLSASSPQRSATDYYCKWTLVGPGQNTKIHIDVLDSYLRFSSNCQAESVTVYDGGTIYSSTLGRWCGSETPKFTSSGLRLVIVFKANKYSNGGGFRLRYREAPGKCSKSPRKLVATTKEKRFTLPEYYTRYSGDACLSWRLTAQPGLGVRAKFKTKKTQSEFSRKCSTDYVEIYRGFDRNLTSIKQWCGDMSDTFYCAENYMYIEYHTTSNRYRGVEVEYEAHENPCYIQPDPESSKNVTGVVVGVVGAISLASFMLLVGVLVSRWRKRSGLVTRAPPIPPPENRISYTQTTETLSIERIPVQQSVRPSEMTAPPSYAEVISKNFQGILLGPPPTYQEGLHQVPYQQNIVQSQVPWNQGNINGTGAAAFM